MPSLNDYKNYVLKNEKFIGRVHKSNSDLVIEKTWWNDIDAVKAFIYDYDHDDQKDSVMGYDPTKSETKTPIDAKFHVSGYNSLSKDAPAYLLQFKPSQQNPLDYYGQTIGKYQGEFPVGCYIDIPNGDGVYRKWLICDKSMGLQFTKYEILPCNYNFMWIDNVEGTPVKRKMWGVARMRNSYNSGIWTDYKFTTVENQDQIWLPSNDISMRISYNQRIIVSAPIEQPTTWQVTKPENFHPFGLHKITIYQTKFDTNNDYVNLETGEMYADYYSLGITPVEESVVEPTQHLNLSCSGSTKDIVIRTNGKTITASIVDGDTVLTDITPEWSFTYKGEIITESNDEITISHPTNNSVKIVATKDSAMYNTITVNATYNGLSDNIELYIKSL